MALTKFTDLVEMLAAVGVPMQPDAAEQTLRGAIKSPPLETELVLCWRDPLLSISCRVLADVAVARLQAIESAVCRANNGIAIPGFVIDYGAKAIHFKVTLLTVEGIEEATLRTMMEATVDYARDFLPALVKIAAGEAMPERLAELVEVTPPKTS